MQVQTTGKAAIRFGSYDAFKKKLNETALGNGGGGGKVGSEPMAVQQCSTSL
jgi:hypothetical protein